MYVVIGNIFAQRIPIQNTRCTVSDTRCLNYVMRSIIIPHGTEEGVQKRGYSSIYMPHFSEAPIDKIESSILLLLLYSSTVVVNHPKNGVDKYITGNPINNPIDY